MGSCCSSHQQEIEENKEMKDGLIPKFENTVEVDEKEEIKETEKENENMKNMKSMKENKKEVKQSLYNFSQNYQQDSMDSDFINSEQKISEEIYDYFNDIRNNPQNYLSEGQKNGIQNVISTAAEKAVEGNIQNILKNPHLEMVFDNCVKTNRDSKEEILKSFEKEEKVKNREKALYMILGNSNKPKDCVWSLLKTCEKENKGEILWKDIEYLLVSTMFLQETKNILCYFLFIFNAKKINE